MPFLQPEDYTEPICPLCSGNANNSVHPIDISRAIQKLDEYLNRNDYAGAERHINYWIDEAKAGNDLRGELAMQNELMGLHRKCGNEAKARSAASDALILVEKLNMSDTVTAATTFLNAATVEKAFGSPEAAIPLYSAAEHIYKAALSPSDERLGGLYNNYALALSEMKRYSEAKTYYDMALEVMKSNPNHEPEQAITFLNIADMTEAEKGIENGADEIQKCVETAEHLLDAETLPHDGNYAFVCEKCAPSFDYYGFFAFAEVLRKRAKEIYERT
jgi:tetratricopeptide (TPR) repeat protein